MRRAALLALGFAASVACHLPLPSPPSLEDAAPPADRPRADGGADGTARSEAPRSDAPRADAPPGKSCDQIYGAALEYVLCKETPTTCEFSARTEEVVGQPDTCKTLCEKLHGPGACVTAYDNPSPPEDPCTRNSEDTCTTPRTWEICICKR